LKARDRLHVPQPLENTMTRLQVRDLMTDTVFTVKPDDSLAMVRDLMMEHNVRHVPVVDGEGDLVGLLSHRDLLRTSLVEQSDVPGFVAEEVMQRIKVEELASSSVESVDPETELREAAQLMLEYQYGCLPVTVGRRLVGILTEADFVRFLADED
jgi:CBS domain-containing membrane protein